MRHLARLNKYFVKYKFHLILGIVFVAFSNYFRVLMPRTIREALNFVFVSLQEYRLLDGSIYQQELTDFVTFNLLVFGAVVLGVAIIMGVFMFFMRQTIIVMSRLIEYDMRKEIFAHYTALDLEFFKRNKTGDLMSRISEDVSKVRMYLGPALLYGINLISLFAIVITSMITVSPSLTFYTLLPLPILSISIYFVSVKINQKSTVIQRQLAALNSRTQEVYSGIRVIKAYVKESQFGRYFEDESGVYKAKSLELAKVQAFFFPLMIFLVSISTLITLYVGGQQVNQGLISPGNIAEFIIYVNMLTWPITSLGWIASLIQEAAASQERINEFMDVKPTLINHSVLKPKNFDIAFENVTFTYPETGITALLNISFTLKKGEKMAIIGKTASGKTSVAELILRMYDVDNGRVTVGGQDIRELDKYALREKISYVPQDVFLFTDTITDNILFGANEHQDVKKYAKYAAIHEDIEDLPKKYETMVGERGLTLSGGQKQRISIARALISSPEIVILDDALSAVDANTENIIVNSFNTALKDVTTIVITHRIQRKMNYDKIMVLEDGKIQDIGSHEELFNKNDYYTELVSQTMQ